MEMKNPGDQNQYSITQKIHESKKNNQSNDGYTSLFCCI